MFDEQEYQKQFFSATYSDKFKKAYSGGSSSGSKFPYLATSRLENGAYSIRLLPPMPEKCPEGWLRVASHSFLVNAGDEKPTRVECIFKGEESPCYVCEVLEALADDLNSLPTSMKELLEKARPIVKLVLPVVITAEPVGDTGKWRKSSKEHGAMLEIYARTLQEKFGTLMVADRYLNHSEKGRYIVLTKNHNQMDVMIPSTSEPGPMKDPSFIAPSSYPHVVNAHTKYLKKLSYDHQEEFVQECFWFKDPKISSIIKANFYDNPMEDSDEDKLPWE